MPQFDERHVKLCGGVLVWDGITRPETQQQGKNAGKPKWTLKALFPPQCADLGLFDQLANKQLAESKFKGVLPQGGRMPILPVGPQEFNGMFPGWFCINFKSTLKCPDVYDPNGQPLDPMQYGPMLYPGQSIDVLAHVYDYDQAGNKGIGAGMDAIGLNLNAQAPRLDIGTGGIDTASAFGGAGGQAPQQQPAQQPPAQQGYQTPPQQQPAYQQPQGAPAGQPAYGQPAQQPAGQPAYGQPAYGQPAYQAPGGVPAGQDPNQHNAAYQQPAGQPAPQQQPGQYPQQAQNFMPPQQ